MRLSARPCVLLLECTGASVVGGVVAFVCVCRVCLLQSGVQPCVCKRYVYLCYILYCDVLNMYAWGGNIFKRGVFFFLRDCLFGGERVGEGGEK